MMRYLILLFSLAVSAIAAPAAAFPLVAAGRAATVLSSPDDYPVVALAVTDLTRDIASVTGITATTGHDEQAASGPVLLVGTLGKSALIDQLVTAKKIALGDLPGAWESFVITRVDHPFPDVPQALVIVGSDARGTAFGAYELSAMIGVSPWHWWADVAPAHRDELTIPAGFRRFGPPSVKFRGIFINDEDWGLEPWAAKTFDPTTGNIGPKTYAKVFELLLRLKANTLWPAMHEVTRPFNLDPANAVLADRYGIIMGSSHAEPLLRNNVGEWRAPKPDYNYVTNREGVRSYWEERVKTNGRFENLYTLGMRGIHDSGIQGTTSDAQRIQILEQVFADQRDLLARHVSAPVEAIPQIFVAYKEVLDLYRQGLQVPDDVTLVWPDDNFGYVRNFAAPAERERGGGFGIYYHLSYLGRPMAYLWLGTTPPALIWEEMSKAYAYGADRVWIANVGDLKAAEITTDFFLRLAWDINAYGPDAQPRFLRDWAGQTFGPSHAKTIADVLDRSFKLNHIRRPEHLQWWTPLKEEPHTSPLSLAEINQRLDAFAGLTTDTDALAAALPPGQQDAFFELVGYPVHGAALANQRYFAGELGELETARAADQALHTLTAKFDMVADGKWRGFMQLEPADDDWRSMRIAAWTMPAFAPKTEQVSPGAVTLSAADFSTTARSDDGPQTPRWQLILGLGHSGRAVTVLPFDAPATAAPRLTTTIDLPAAGAWTLQIHRVSTHPISIERGLLVSLQIDDRAPQTVDLSITDGSAAWSQGVLDNQITTAVDLGPLTAGSHRVTLSAGPGVVLDSVTLIPTP